MFHSRVSSVVVLEAIMSTFSMVVSKKFRVALEAVVGKKKTVTIFTVLRWCIIQFNVGWTTFTNSAHERDVFWKRWQQVLIPSLPPTGIASQISQLFSEPLICNNGSQRFDVSDKVRPRYLAQDSKHHYTYKISEAGENESIHIPHSLEISMYSFLQDMATTYSLSWNESVPDVCS